MRAIGLRKFGGPEVLEVVELDRPEPSEGEVLVRVQSVAVNPTDATFRSGGRAVILAKVRPPYIPGMDFAGVVERLGASADGRLSIGDGVVGYVLPFGPRGGTYAEYISVGQASVTAAPRGTDFDEASTLILNAVTADLALDALALSPGQTVAVTGASGAVGGYAVQLAKARGLRVIADAGPADVALVESLGADDIVPRGDTFDGAIRTVLPGGAAALIDAACLDARALSAMSDDGVIVSIKRWDGPAERGIRVAKVSSFGSSTDTARFERLVSLVEEGALTLRVARVMPFTEAADAHRAMAAGGTRGRIVLGFAR